MTSPSDRISSSEFVIHLNHGVGSVKLRKLLQPLGDFEPIPGHADTYVVRLVKHTEDARRGWEKLRKAVGKEGQVLPVFLNEDDQPNYSVGTLQVRFASPPSDAELQAWLPDGLRVKARNEYVPAQVALEPAEPGKQYLPDLISELREHSGEQVQVWPETLQAFRKA